jgi:pimeloyl-ACP methyl ester carboxylesterase
MVLVKPHLRPKDYVQLRLLADRFRVIQIEPLGFGASDRPQQYPESGVAEQVLEVLEHERVDRFGVWGYSQGGAMAAVVAQASSRAAALIAGGCSLLHGPTDRWIARMDRERRVPVASGAFWHCYKGFDWRYELGAMPCPKLSYVGADDTARAAGVARTSELLAERGVSVVAFDGLDHRTCNQEPAVSTRVVPAILDWLGSHVTPGW